jgi:O-antigen/teichoic acid export membrane protein
LIEKIKDKINTPLVLNTAKMSSSNVLMYLLPLIVTPILSRLYGPEPFGEWGVFSSFITIVTIGIFLGFENTIVKAEEKNVKNILLLCLVISLSICILFTIIFYIGNVLHIHFFEEFPSSEIMIIYLIVYSIYTIFFNLCNRYEQFSSLAFSNVVLGLSQALFRILFGIVALTAINGLILGTTIAEVSAMIFLFFCMVKTSSNWRKQIIRLSEIKHIIRRYKNFPLYDAPSSMMSFAALNLPIIILAYYFDKQSIGCYSIVLQLLLLPMSFIGSAIGKVYYQELCQQAQTPEQMKSTTGKVIRITAFISILPLLFIACGGDKIIVLFLGTKWTTAGDVALCLSLWAFPTILTQPLLPLFRTLDKQRTLLYYDIAYFILGIGSILLLCYFDFSLYAILITYALVCFIVKLCLFRRILLVSDLKWAICQKYIPLWLISIAVLTVRLILLS